MSPLRAIWRRLAAFLAKPRERSSHLPTSPPRLLAATLRRALVLSGDGTDLELLEAERIGRSDVLVSVIDNDERNLLASLLGRQLGVRKIITRVSKPANLRLFERVGIDVAISARGVWPWLVFGLVLAAAVLYFVGSFQGSELLHDLLHDGRHLLGIPCH